MAADEAVAGGIDMGGTKIEAALFDAAFHRLSHRRIDTPADDYRALLDAVAEQVAWLRHARRPDLPVGMGAPGFFNPTTGIYHAANLAAAGKPFRADLECAVPRLVAAQDLACFCLSEATGGAGAGASRVFGLALGTGIGGALAVDGVVEAGFRGLAGEVGHVPIGAALVARHALPVLPCGCGLTGCVETLGSGPGMMRIAAHVTGRPVSPPDLVRAALAGDDDAARAFGIWCDVVCQVLLTVQLTFDPEVVVLGGGLSRIEGLAGTLNARFADAALPGTLPFAIRTNRFGDASGARGAAIMALRAATG